MTPDYAGIIEDGGHCLDQNVGLDPRCSSPPGGGEEPFGGGEEGEQCVEKT